MRVIGKQTTMPRIMLFVTYRMFNKACTECLLLQAVRSSGYDECKRLHEPNAAVLIVPGQQTKWTSMKNLHVQTWMFRVVQTDTTTYATL